MTKNHLKRHATPTSWPIKRKGIPFVTRPKPGGHPAHLSMPLGTVMIELLAIAGTKREVRQILTTKESFVDGARRYRVDSPAGFMDVISFPEAKSYHRIFLDGRGRLFTYAIPAAEAKLKLCKIRSKTSRAKDAVQLGFTDGRTLRVKADAGYKVGDGVLLDVEKNEIREHLPLEKGMQVLLTAGKHCGQRAEVTGVEGRTILLKNEEKEFTTRRLYAFVLAKGKPPITLPE